MKEPRMSQPALKPLKSVSAYGEGLGSRLRAQSTTFVCPPPNATVAVTELRSENPEHGMSAPLDREDAFLVGYHLVDYPVHEFFEDGHAAPVTALVIGQTSLYDLKRDPRFKINKAIHGVYFYFPRAALDALADESQAPRIGELHYRPGVGVHDVLMQALVGSLLPAFENPEWVSRLFIAHVVIAVGIHVAKTYGGMKPFDGPVRGGLAPWQERRATEFLAANLDGNVSLNDIARQCGLSISHFSRAFRQSTGLAPHRWLVHRRIEAAKALLRKGALSLSDVALRCGFADQSHLTRTFSGVVGSSPGIWRRQFASDAY